MFGFSANVGVAVVSRVASRSDFMGEMMPESAGNSKEKMPGCDYFASGHGWFEWWITAVGSLGGADRRRGVMRCFGLRNFLELWKRAEGEWFRFAGAAARGDSECESGGGECRQNADHGDSDGILGS